jgi:hypothetical protein
MKQTTFCLALLLSCGVWANPGDEKSVVTKNVGSSSKDVCGSMNVGDVPNWEPIPLEDSDINKAIKEQIQEEEKMKAASAKEPSSHTESRSRSPSPSKYPFKPFNYLDLNLAIKNQMETSSCLSQSLSTLLEAYMKRHSLAQNEWSGFDLYFCKLKLLKTWVTLTVKSATNARIASAECPSSKGLSKYQLSGYCDKREQCTEKSALIKKLTDFEPKGNTAEVIDKLKKYGPLLAGVRWNAAIAQYNHEASIPDCVTDMKKVFYTKDYARTKGLSNKVKEALMGHAVTIVGFDYDTDGSLYWIVQNSHGKDAGFKGYLYLGEKELSLTQFPMAYLEEAELGSPLTHSRDGNAKKTKKN